MRSTPVGLPLTSSATSERHGSMSLPEFEIYAIKYAERMGTRAGMFAGGDPHDGPMAMDYFLWALRSSDRTIVVDTGFCRSEGEGRGRTFLRTPEEALDLVGVTAAEVSDVVITHMHYDHGGNLESFPNARFHVQDVEMQFVTGRSMTHHALRHSFRLDDVLEMVRLVYGERVRFHDGDVTGPDAGLGEGLSLHLVAGHTPGQMSVRVNTARGWVVVASDAAHYYEHFLGGRPFTTYESLAGMMEGHRRIRTLADSDDHVVPGHDPLVLERYPAPSADLAGAVAALHLTPSGPLPSTTHEKQR